MSRLDTRHPELDLYLHRVRRRLNARVLAGGALTGAATVSAVAWVAAWWAPPRLRVAVWAVLTGLGALGGAAAAWRLRVSLAQGGAWLDEVHDTQGAFAAAVEALDRDNERFPDALVLRDADRQRREHGLKRLPWKRLAVRALVFLAVLGSTGATLTWLPETVTRLATPAPSARPEPLPRPAPEADTPGAATTVSPHETARRLFPESERLAALAEQALASGDAGALDSLLSQNPSSSSQAPVAPRAPGPRPRGGDPGMGSGGQGEGEAGGQSRPSPGNGSPSSPTPRAGDAPSSSPGTSGQPGNSENSGAQGPGRGGGNLPGSGRGNPGTGHSDQKLAPGPGGAPNDRRVIIPDQASPGVFETILPETGARVPLAQVLPDSRRAAEAALNRSSAPLEYDNAIRAYFLSLSQEASP